MNNWTLIKLKLNEYKRSIFLTHKTNFRSHGKQCGGCEVRRMNPTLDQRSASPDAGRKNPTGQQLGSNGLDGKLLLLIYKGGIF